MSQGIVIGLLLGSLLGVLVVTVTWLIVGGIKMRKHVGEDGREQSAMNVINQACEGINGLIASVNPATVNLIQFQSVLTGQIAAVRSTVESQRDVLEYYYLKYIERSIADYDQVVTRIDDLLRAMGKGNIRQIGVDAPVDADRMQSEPLPPSQQQQQQQQQFAFTTTLESAPTLMDVPLSAIMNQPAHDVPAMPELSVAPPVAPVAPAVSTVAPAPVSAPAPDLPPSATVIKAAAPVTPVPVPDASVHDTRALGRALADVIAPPVRTPPARPRQSPNETAYFEMADATPVSRDADGIKLAEAFVLGGTLDRVDEPMVLSAGVKAGNIDNAFALPNTETGTPPKGKAAGAKKDAHDSAIITGDDLEEKLDSFFKL